MDISQFNFTPGFLHLNIHVCIFEAREGAGTQLLPQENAIQSSVCDKNHKEIGQDQHLLLARLLSM